MPLGSVSGIGDASLLAKYRMTGDDGPGFALVGGITLPTGSAHRHSLDGERMETEHQPGTGSWDPIVRAAAGTMAGSLRVNASALYQFSTKVAQDSGGAAVGFDQPGSLRPFAVPGTHFSRGLSAA